MAFTATYTVSQKSVSLSSQRPVRAQWVDVNELVKPHDHAYHEICVILQGTVLHRTAAGETRIGAGRTIVVPPKAVHALKPFGPVRAVNVYYLAEWLATDLAILWAEPNLVPLFLSQSVIAPRGEAQSVEFDLTANELSAVCDELRDIDSESQNPAASSMLIRGAFLKVLARLSRASLRMLPRWQYFRPELQAAISHIERLVQSASPLDLGNLSDETHLSRDYLGKLFSAAMGRTLSDYFQLRRVHRACQLLVDPRYSITEIALELGYSDAPHLCRMFKRYRGMSPMAYRSTYASGS
jgi:AraC family L-rhamnose operon regulatory protein RhaS